MKKDARVAAVLLAGGTGERFKTRIPKQYIQVHNKPILYHTLRKFLDCNIFSEIIVVVHPRWIRKAPLLLTKHLSETDNKRITFIKGGRTRSWSSYNAVKYLRSRRIDYILFHDGVRPFIETKLIKKVVQSTQAQGAAITAVKSIESVAESVDLQVTNVLPSKNLYFLQTPECFRYDEIVEVYDRLSRRRKFFDTATNLHLFFALGKTIRIVLHHERNLKLTFMMDLVMAEEILK